MKEFRATVRTSSSDPLGVGWAWTDGRARLGLTMAPGKKAWSRLGGYWWDRDLTQDLKVLARSDVGLLVCLLEDQELVALRIQGLTSEARGLGIAVRRLRIPDAGVPSHRGSARRLVRAIVGALRAGRTVVVHCAGGLGRSGLIAGCVMVELGMTSTEALAALRRARGPGCPETDAQRRFVKEWCATESQPSG